MFILQVIKCLELNGAKRVICSKSAQILEQLSMLLRPAMKLIAARNKTRQSPFIPAKLLRPATKQVRTLQFSARQILNCLHSLRPVIDVIAARNKGGSEPEFAIFRDLFLGLEGV